MRYTQLWKMLSVALIVFGTAVISANVTFSDPGDSPSSGNSSDSNPGGSGGGISSGTGSGDSSDTGDGPGSGSGGDDDRDNSGSGSGDDDDRDNSGSGSGNDDDRDDSGSGSADDDDRDNSGSGSGDDDDRDTSGLGSGDDEDRDNSRSGSSSGNSSGPGSGGSFANAHLCPSNVGIRDSSGPGSGGSSRSGSGDDDDDRQSNSGPGSRSDLDGDSRLVSSSGSGSRGSSGPGRSCPPTGVLGSPLNPEQGSGQPISGVDQVNQENQLLLEAIPVIPQAEPGILERVRHMKITDGEAIVMVSLTLLTDEIRGRAKGRNFPKPENSVDRAALCLTAPNTDVSVLFVGDNRIDSDAEDESWQISDLVKPEINFETLVGVRVEVINVGRSRIPEASRPDACSDRNPGDVVLARELLAEDVEVLRPPVSADDLGPSQESPGTLIQEVGGNFFDVRQKAKLDLGGPSGPVAEVELRLESGRLEVKAKGEELVVDPDGTGQRNRYALCVSGLFIDDDRVEDKGRVEMEEEVNRSPFSSLLGLTIRIIDVGDDHLASNLTNAACSNSAVAVLEHTVTFRDLD